MKCPKCRCIVQDYSAECPKCHRDLSSVRASLGLYAFRPDPPMLLDALPGLGQMDRGRFAFSREESPDAAEADLSWLNVIPEQQSEVEVGGEEFETGNPGSDAAPPVIEAPAWDFGPVGREKDKAEMLAGLERYGAEEPLLEAEVDLLPLDMADDLGEWSPDEDAGRKTGPDGKSRLK